MANNIHGRRIVCFLLVLCAVSAPPPAESSPENCLALYKDAGAPGIIRSPQCPVGPRPRRSPPPDCQVATLQGRRRYQEDRAVCALGIKIPFPERKGFREIEVGVVAVFDGHNGDEASDMASKLVIDYFLLHTYYLLNEKYTAATVRRSEMLLASGEEPNLGLDGERQISPTVFGRPFHLEILKESLSRTIYDIDATFTKEALRKNLKSGSTATIVLIADGHILASNIGDSKALLCSESPHPPGLQGGSLRLRRRQRRNRQRFPLQLGGNGSGYVVKELTENHHPDRDQEKKRVEAAGGYVSEWTDIPRVNGQLAISRSIGDLSFKSYGVISTPEVTDWQMLTANDSYLVAASDGIFEKMSTQDVCDLLWDDKTVVDRTPKCTNSVMQSLADCIVRVAFESGSMDNLSVVVLPLRSSYNSGGSIEDMTDLEGSSLPSYFGLKSLQDKMFSNLLLVPPS